MTTAPLETTAPCPKRTPWWLKTVLFVAILSVWYVLSAFLPIQECLLNLLARIQTMGALGLAAFVLLYVPTCVLMLPDILPNGAAGAIWGVGLGTVAVSLGRLLGGTITFLIARWVAGSWVRNRMAADPKFAAVSEAVGREGFKIVLLLRLCPLFPVIMLNYALGLSRVSLKAYAAGTLIGMLPRTILVAYVGSGARSLADLAGGANEAQPSQPLVFWGGLVLTVVVVILIGIQARRMLNAATAPQR